MEQQDKVVELSQNEQENTFAGGWVLLVYTQNGKRIAEYIYEVN